MTETLEKTELQFAQEFIRPEIAPATNEDIIAYLCHSQKIAEIAAKAELDAFILGCCEQLDITLSDEELQAAGDAFRLEHKLLGASETLMWLSKQRISVDKWSEGIRITLLTNKLKLHLFGDAVDSHYLSDRNDYKRVALSQILVDNLAEAMRITYAIREENASFCALALQNSKGQQSKNNGGFVGIRFLSGLLPEITQAIAEAKVGEVIGPIQTQLGYHIMRIEEWFPAELNESTREEILESFFQAWLQAVSTSTENFA